ncbi:MAG: redoxin family protein [Armatimonadota bacterium]
MMRSVVLGACLVVMFGGVAVADDAVEVFIYGERQQLEPPAVVRDGVVYLPVRAIAEAVGAEVTYLPHGQAVVVCSGERCTDMPNEQSIEINGRILVPLEVLDEALDVEIDWYPESGQVAVRSGAVGMKAAPIVLPGVSGPYSRTSFDDKAAVVVVFWANHCPTVQRYEERFVRLVADYLPRNVEFVAVGSNDGERYPADNFENMKLRAAEKGYNFFYVRDESQQVARAYGPERTPDVFLVNSDGFVVYRGRIEDAEDPAQVTRHDLREALDELLAGASITVRETPPHGCTIKWKQ